MKTPEYIKKAQADSRERKKAQGFKWFSVLAAPEVVERLKELYRKLTKEKASV